MKHLFVSYEIAKHLEEKGFNESCLKIWNIYSTKTINLYDEIDSWGIGSVPAPLYQQVIDWFRINHNMSIEVTLDDEDTYSSHIFNVKTTNLLETGRLNSPYYECLNVAIEEAINLI